MFGVLPRRLAVLPLRPIRKRGKVAPMRLTTTITILALVMLAAGCSTVELKPLGTEVLRNAQGHVIGQKETLCDCRSGEKLARIALYLPRVDERGEVVGYEELVRGGSVLRDLNGRRIGGRWVCLGRRRDRSPQTGPST